MRPVSHIIEVLKIVIYALLSEKKELTAALLLDLSAAFDVVDLDIFLKKWLPTTLVPNLSAGLNPN